MQETTRGSIGTDTKNVLLLFKYYMVGHFNYQWSVLIRNGNHQMSSACLYQIYICFMCKP